MHKKITTHFLLLLAFWGGFSFNLWAQSPPCIIDTAIVSAPNLYPDTLADAYGCTFYSMDITFLMPRDTVVSGVTVNFNTFTINSVTGLPPGLSWQCNNFANGCVYDVSPGNPDPDTLGCVRISGVPIQQVSPYVYTGTITVTATTDNILQPTVVTTFTKNLRVFPCVSPAICFTFSQNAFCEPVSISSLQPIQSLQSNGNQGFTYTWTMGANYSSNAEFPASPSPLYFGGDSILNLTVNIDTVGYLLDSIKVTQINCTDGIGGGQPDLYWGLWQGATNLIPLTNPVSGGPAIPFKIPTNFYVSLGSSFNFQLWDDDSPLSDDGCVTNTSGGASNAEVNFTVNGGGWFTATNGGLSIQYHVTHTIFSNTCSDTIPIAKLPVAPNIQVVAGDTSMCPGETVTLAAFGSPTQYSYQWYKNDTLIANATSLTYQANATGSYTVSVTNTNLCTSESAPQIVTVNPNPSFTVTPTTGVNSITYTVSNVQPTGVTYYYLWYKNNVQDGNAFGPNYTATTSGTYKVCVQNALTECIHCQTFAPFTTSIEETALSGLKVYPNPVEDELKVEMNWAEEREVNILVKDMLGREVVRKALGKVNGELQTQLDLSNLSRGIYHFSIVTEKGEFSTKLVVQ
ncbi:MAG: T9SS type A sorting domain-containing protein [Bacteroidia bacterium]